jgi:hypothetical protein
MPRDPYQIVPQLAQDVLSKGASGGRRHDEALVYVYKPGLV